MSDNKPWDARLAYRLIYPLRESPVTPNHLTCLRLLFGVLACVALARGDYLWTNVGAICFALSNFLDHTDGELARLTGKLSKFGHNLDLGADAIVNVLLFIGIGLGLAGGKLAGFALPMGILAGLAVAAIFHMRLVIEKHVGKAGARQPNLGGMEAEDVLYLLPLVTLADQLLPFLVLAAIGAPLFALWVLKEFLSLDKNR